VTKRRTGTGAGPRGGPMQRGRWSFRPRPARVA